MLTHLLRVASVAKRQSHIDALVQDCSNASALAMELLQSCTKPLIYQCYHSAVQRRLPGHQMQPTNTKGNP